MTKGQIAAWKMAVHGLIRLLNSDVRADGTRMSYMIQAMGLVKCGAFVMPEEMEKILRADDSEVVEIAHGQAPAFYCFETWEGTTHRVILAPPGTTPGQIMHELAHIDLEHDSQERVWFWQKIRQEYEANKLAIEMGAAPEVMAAGMSTYFRPLPDFIRRKIAGFLLDTEVSNKRWEPIDPPVNWVDEWLDYIQE